MIQDGQTHMIKSSPLTCTVLSLLKTNKQTKKNTTWIVHILWLDVAELGDIKGVLIINRDSGIKNKSAVNTCSLNLVNKPVVSGNLRALCSRNHSPDLIFTSLWARRAPWWAWLHKYQHIHSTLPDNSIHCISFFFFNLRLRYFTFERSHWFVSENLFLRMYRSLTSSIYKGADQNFTLELSLQCPDAMK